MGTFHRVPSIRAVVGAVKVDQGFAGNVGLLGTRLLDVYRPLLGAQTCVRTLEVPNARTLVVAVTDEHLEPIRIGDRLVWGVPVGHEGEATDREVEDALRRPEAGRELLGVYVLMAIEPRRVRLATSAALSKTLRRVDGPRGSAFVTRALAGHVLAGGELQMSEAIALDFVLFEFPMGPDELLAGTRVLEEATVVDLEADRTACWSYWPAPERVAVGPPTTAEGLRDVVAETSMRLSRVPDAHIALTAGRDSTLLAASLGWAGGLVDTFTLGTDDVPDAVGAAHTAETLGWRHRAVPIGLEHPEDRFAEIVRWAPLARGTPAGLGLRGELDRLGGPRSPLCRRSRRRDRTILLRPTPTSARRRAQRASPSRVAFADRLLRSDAGTRCPCAGSHADAWSSGVGRAGSPLREVPDAPPLRPTPSVPAVPCVRYAVPRTQSGVGSPRHPA